MYVNGVAWGWGWNVHPKRTFFLCVCVQDMGLDVCRWDLIKRFARHCYHTRHTVDIGDACRVSRWKAVWRWVWTSETANWRPNVDSDDAITSSWLWQPRRPSSRRPLRRRRRDGLDRDARLRPPSLAASATTYLIRRRTNPVRLPASRWWNLNRTPRRPLVGEPRKCGSVDEILYRIQRNGQIT